MGLFPPQYFRKTRGEIRSGFLTDRPSHLDVLEGTLYFATDFGSLVRATPTGWESYVPYQILNTLDLGSGQIKFPAIQNPSADPNTLDDYEEVPSFAVTLVSSGGGTPTYTTNSGRATKEGDKVMGSFIIVLSGLGTLAAGTLTIAGMPFTASATNGIPFMCIFSGLGVAQIYIYNVINPSTTSLLLRKQTAAAVGNATDLTVADITAGFVIAGGFEYFT